MKERLSLYCAWLAACHRGSERGKGKIRVVVVVMPVNTCDCEIHKICACGILPLCEGASIKGSLGVWSWFPYTIMRGNQP